MKYPVTKSLMAAAFAALISLPGFAAEPSEDPITAPMDSTAVPEENQVLPQDPTALQPGMPQTDPERTEELQMGGDDPLAAPAQNAVLALTPDQLERMTVVDPAGRKVGKVEQLVRSKQSGSIEAVISSGGVLGIDATEIAVPIDALELSDQEQLKIQASGEELAAREGYKPDSYVPLEPADRPLGDFPAVESIPATP
jgi:hypothetical protein